MKGCGKKIKKEANSSGWMFILREREKGGEFDAAREQVKRRWQAQAESEMTLKGARTPVGLGAFGYSDWLESDERAEWANEILGIGISGER
jgi:hypothetical protein